MPSPIEFWLCASSFNPFNVLIAQPVTDDTCEVIPRGVMSMSDNNDPQSLVGITQIQTLG